jgi:hypothetical protein
VEEVNEAEQVPLLNTATRDKKPDFQKLKFKKLFLPSAHQKHLFAHPPL